MFSGKLPARLLVVLVAFACTSGGNQGSGVPVGPAGTQGSVSETPGTSELGSSPSPAVGATATSTPAVASIPSAPAVLATPDPRPTPEPPVTSDRVALSGVLAVRIGDPPPGSSLPPRENATLTDGQGKAWTLTFDDTIYRPPGGLLSFNLKRVNVEGTLMAPDTVLVTSMALDP